MFQLHQVASFNGVDSFVELMPFSPSRHLIPGGNTAKRFSIQKGDTMHANLYLMNELRNKPNLHRTIVQNCHLKLE